MQNLKESSDILEKFNKKENTLKFIAFNTK
jgi:hypothetical protein